MSHPNETPTAQVATSGLIAAWLSLLLPLAGAICIYSSYACAARNKFGYAWLLMATVVICALSGAVAQILAIDRSNGRLGCLGILSQPLLLAGIVVAGWFNYREYERWAEAREGERQVAKEIERTRHAENDRANLERRRAAELAKQPLSPVNLPDVAHGTLLTEYKRIKRSQGHVGQLVYAHTARLLIAGIGSKSYFRAFRVDIYDTSSGKLVTSLEPTNGFLDFDLSPDEATLFLIDHTNQLRQDLSGTLPNYVYRYTLATREIDVVEAPTVVEQVEAIDAERFLMLTRRRPTYLSLHQWAPGAATYVELASEEIGDWGKLEYDPRRNWAYFVHGSGRDAHFYTWQVYRGSLERTSRWRLPSTNSSGGNLVLSVDGQHLFYSTHRIDPLNQSATKSPHSGVIAAGADIAITRYRYSDALTGRELGQLRFEACAFSRDGAFVATAQDGQFVIYRVGQR